MRAIYDFGWKTKMCLCKIDKPYTNMEQHIVNYCKKLSLIVRYICGCRIYTSSYINLFDMVDITIKSIRNIILPALLPFILWLSYNERIEYFLLISTAYIINIMVVVFIETDKWYMTPVISIIYAVYQLFEIILLFVGLISYIWPIKCPNDEVNSDNTTQIIQLVPNQVRSETKTQITKNNELCIMIPSYSLPGSLNYSNRENSSSSSSESSNESNDSNDSNESNESSSESENSRVIP